MAYTLKGRKSGTVKFKPMQDGVVEKESESYSSFVTSSPIENGSDINDHVNNEAGTFSISGEIIGGKSAVDALKRMRDNRDIVTYTGKTKVDNLVFTSLKFDFSYKNKTGVSFAASFQRVQLTKSKKNRNGESMSEQDSGKSRNKQHHASANAGTRTVASATVSSASLTKLKNAAKRLKSSASPLSRRTGG
ncbi:MAG: hypothetical protein IJ799_07780, partial [Bacteroidales bacterium]|nr:hypothetical protein [Bacteroidales bacterium]